MLRYFPVIERGDVAAFGPIVARFGFSSAMQAQDYRGRTALHVAAEHGRDEIVAMLLAHNAKPEAEDDGGFTALHLAAELGNLKIVTQLLEKKTESVKIRTRERGLTALHLAIANGHAAVVQHLLAVSPGLIEVGDLTRKTVLQFAAEYGQEDIFAMLMTQHDNETALHSAIIGDFETIIARLLIEKPHLLDVKDGFGRTPLHVAAEYGPSTLVEQLIELRPAFLSATIEQGATVLHVAAKKGQAAVIPLLLAAKPDLLDIEDNYKVTALRWACTNAHENVVALLLSYKPRVVDVSCCISALGSEPNEKIVFMLLAHNPRLVDEVRQGDQTILHFAFGVNKGLRSEELIAEVWRLCAPELVRTSHYQLHTPLHVAVNSHNNFAIELVHAKFSVDELVKIFRECWKTLPRSLVEKHCGAPLLSAVDRDDGDHLRVLTRRDEKSATSTSLPPL